MWQLYTQRITSVATTYESTNLMSRFSKRENNQEFLESVNITLTEDNERIRSAYTLCFLPFLRILRMPLKLMGYVLPKRVGHFDVGTWYATVLRSS